MAWLTLTSYIFINFDTSNSNSEYTSYAHTFFNLNTMHLVGIYPFLGQHATRNFFFDMSAYFTTNIGRLQQIAGATMGPR